MSRDARYWIEKLGLIEHPEGGHYRETYRSRSTIPAGTSEGHPAGRPCSTAIYYLLRSGEVSRLHRLRSDELFHFYCGSPLAIHVLGPGEAYEQLCLGADPERGQLFQAVIHAGCWFGAEVRGADSFSLVGCTVAPGFDFADLELAQRSRLLELYPDRRSLVERLTQ